MGYSDKWLAHFQRAAFAARDSVKEVTKVGAALIGPNNEILLTAYNGPAIGVQDSPDRRSRTNGLKYKYSSHAERNLISFAARRGISTEGLTVYATHYPCSGCANALVQAGIKCVIVGYGEYKSSDGDIDHARRILQECKVQVRMHFGSEKLEQADALARAVLLDKHDKNGESLYYHSVRVARDIPTELPVSYKIAALLHDVVEHGMPIEAIETMFGEPIANSVKLLTRDPDMTYMEYIDHLCTKTLSSATMDIDSRVAALVVKLADSKDNLDPDRAWEREDEMRPLIRDRYLPAREKMIDTLHHPLVVNHLDLWGLNVMYNGSRKIFSRMPHMLPYILTKKD